MGVGHGYICRCLTENINAKTTQQKTFSYRFQKELNTEAFTAIHRQVLESGGMFRSIVEFVSSTPSTEQLNAALLLKNGQFTDLDQQVAALKQGGINLINSGHLGLINAALNILPSGCRIDPKISMVYAYAKIHGGYALDALTWLPKGPAREKLNDDDRALAAYIELSINYTLGIVTHEQYLRGLSKMEDDEKESTLGIQIKLERLKRMLTSKHGHEIQGAVQEMKAALGQLKSRVGSDPALLTFTEILEWELLGWFIHFDFIHKVSDFRIRLKSGFIMPFSERLRQAQDLMEQNKVWFNKYNELRERTKDSPANHGKVVITGSAIIIHKFAQSRFLAEGEPVNDENILKDVIKVLEDAEKFLASYGLHQMALRARLLIAEGVDGLGETEGGVAIAKEVNNQALELGLIEIQKWAESLIAGKSMFSTARQLEKDKASSPDKVILDTSDEEIERFARDYIKAIGLPKERLNYVIKDMVFTRKNAELRQCFCKYLVLIQNLKHTLKIETVYSIDPLRAFQCRLYGFESDYDDTDWGNLLCLFQLSYCSRCSSRSPVDPYSVTNYRAGRNKKAL